MTAVIQRVANAKVTVDKNTVGAIDEGLLILLGVFKGDTEKAADDLATKISKLRIFTDENDKLNLSVNDIGGAALVVSNFTITANYSHGNRPDYTNAELPERANELYEYFSLRLREALVSHKVENGRFGEHMEITTHFNGPITIVMESDKLKRKK